MRIRLQLSHLASAVIFVALCVAPVVAHWAHFPSGTENHDLPMQQAPAVSAK